eukprot:TRINITY_DN11009_c0_g1_i2.p1 TRINITY_DN11009_c0_g1~~TRINITY_DN11009_c0_g1_i2.p1  ORF type:complete len:122 (-),score=14.88 TRINITY_DN11009_c0_g1_i2:379-744(-)
MKSFWGWGAKFAQSPQKTTPTLTETLKSTNSAFEENYGDGIKITEEFAKFLGPPSEILDHIVLGSSYDAGNHECMDNLNVGFILNVAEECSNLYDAPHVQYLKLIIQDFATAEGNEPVPSF